MAMDVPRRSSWLWRSKQQKRTDGQLFTHNASFDADSARIAPPPPQKLIAQEGDSAEKKLAIALKELAAREESLRQQFKVAGEAVTGWERAEAEIVSLKRETEEQRNMAEMRIRQLEMALKECLKKSREEQKLAEAMESRAQEWSKTKAEMESREMELKRRLLESDAQNSAMAKSLQERARMIAELREGKAMAETESKRLQVKVEAMEKEVSALKYEVHVMNKEADLRNEEKEMNRRAAEAEHKQHLEDVRKIAHLESDCNRLRSLLKKKLPGPAAIAQMKAEVEYAPSSPTSSTSKQRRKKQMNNHYSSSSSSPPPPAMAEASSHSRDMEFMAQRLLCLEEETRRLRDVLASRDAGHGSAPAPRLSVSEMEQPQLQQQQREASPGSRHGGGPPPDNSGLFSSSVQSAEIISVSSEKLHDEDSCSESWASALISELDQFKKDKKQSRRGMSMDSCSFDSITPNLTVTEKPTTMKPADGAYSIPSKEDRSTLRILASRDSQLQSANILCKDALSKMQSAVKELSQIRGGDAEGAMDYSALGEAHGIMVKLDLILDDLRIAVASMGETTSDDDKDDDPPVQTIKATRSSKGTSSASGHDEDEDYEAAAGIKEQLEKEEAVNLEMVKKQLAAATGDLRRSKEESMASKEVIKKLEAQLLETQSRADAACASSKEEVRRAAEEAGRWKEAAMGEQAKRADAEACLSRADMEIGKLQKAVAELTLELAEQKKEYQELQGRWEVLNQKLQGISNRLENNEDRSSCRFEWTDHNTMTATTMATKKEMQERDVVAAKEKLSECQRAIVMLEKQLTSLECGGNGGGGGIMVKNDPMVGSSADNRHSSSSSTMNGLIQQHHQSWNNNSYGGGGGSNQWQQQESMNLSHYQMPPLRIHSDIGYGRGAPAHSYSVGDYLHMDEEHRLSDDGHHSNMAAAAAAARRSSRRQDANPNSNPSQSGQRSTTTGGAAASVVTQGRSTECRPTSFGSRLFGRSNRKQ